MSPDVYFVLSIKESLEKMSTHRKLLTACCAAVLAFGLAACGSSDDDTAADDTPTVEETAGPTQADLDAEKMRADEAEQALADAAAKAARGTAKALKKAIDGSMSPTIVIASTKITVSPADPDDDGPMAVAIAKGDSAGALGSWAGTGYSAKSADTKVSNEAIVFTNQGDARSKPFAEGASFTANLADTADAAAKEAEFRTNYNRATRVLTLGMIELANATKDIAGDDFPKAGIEIYTDDTVTRSVVFDGTYQARRVSTVARRLSTETVWHRPVPVRSPYHRDVVFHPRCRGDDILGGHQVPVLRLVAYQEPSRIADASQRVLR